jgi:hypothetical protein
MNTSYDLGKMTMLSGLIFACPMDQSHENCPFKDLRKLSIESRLMEITNYSNREITQVIIAHKTCLLQRNKRQLVAV